MTEQRGCVDDSTASQEEPDALAGDEARLRLNAALRDAPPACADFELFTVGALTEDDRDLCASICASCPVLQICADYATAARVRFGFWGGIDRTPRRTKKTTEPGGSPATNERNTP